ncbi:chaperone protein dnaJ C76, chloroplastic isoform X2 [Cicer arietinum]|uniref:Chaperone protein dnaJ C76, chloroplastic isoform X2 n=1 Tax=Cicer arietinum TaxID=3827 RepID=A0A1S2YIX4_CICAR|nr:chaperone protein dnaJ C76, chloroplastic isoform X2 [Cicer arietinum]
MAQLLSPVYSEAFKIHNPSLNLCPRTSWQMLQKTSTTWNFVTNTYKRRRCGRLRVAADQDSFATTDSAAAEDYYAVLGLLPDATPEQIKKAYYNCMKTCHPDLSGNDPEVTNFCIFINEVYEVLSDPLQRMIYDEIHGYSLTSINPFLDDSSPKDHVFVDEFSCIGCKNCANVACDVFGIEEDFGRARVYSQCGNPESIQQAIDSCPVDCIHWTSAAQLSLLEDEMRRIERVNVALMLSGMGSASSDVFRMANSRWEKRQLKFLEQARLRMMKQKGYNKTDSYWDNLRGKPRDYDRSGRGRSERKSKKSCSCC